MNIYLISQTQNNNWDTYDSAVVAAPSEEIARNMSPFDGEIMPREEWREYNGWCNSPDLVNVQFLGEAEKYIEQGLICASFNGG